MTFAGNEGDERAVGACRFAGTIVLQGIVFEDGDSERLGDGEGCASEQCEENLFGRHDGLGKSNGLMFKEFVQFLEVGGLGYILEAKVNDGFRGRERGSHGLYLCGRLRLD